MIFIYIFIYLYVSITITIAVRRSAGLYIKGTLFTGLMVLFAPVVMSLYLFEIIKGRCLERKKR